VSQLREQEPSLLDEPELGTPASPEVQSDVPGQAQVQQQDERQEVFL
jgi:hypothetical protein